MPHGIGTYYLMVLGEHNKLAMLESKRSWTVSNVVHVVLPCPANRPLLDVIRLAKARTGQMIRSRKK